MKGADSAFPTGCVQVPLSLFSLYLSLSLSSSLSLLYLVLFFRLLLCSLHLLPSLRCSLA